jgi:transcriptional regulator with XRE-family HTH domain
MASKTLRKTLRSRENNKLIELLVNARDQAGMSQRQLAAALNRPRSFISRIESGERRLDVVEFVAVANALKLDALELFALFIRSAY